jgi:hypothetical protein
VARRRAGSLMTHRRPRRSGGAPRLLAALTHALALPEGNALFVPEDERGRALGHRHSALSGMTPTEFAEHHGQREQAIFHHG